MHTADASRMDEQGYLLHLHRRSVKRSWFLPSRGRSDGTHGAIVSASAPARLSGAAGSPASQTSSPPSSRHDDEMTTAIPLPGPRPPTTYSKTPHPQNVKNVIGSTLAWLARLTIDTT